jgi:hypothetical protein
MAAGDIDLRPASLEEIGGWISGAANYRFGAVGRGSLPHRLAGGGEIPNRPAAGWSTRQKGFGKMARNRPLRIEPDGTINSGIYKNPPPVLDLGAAIDADDERRKITTEEWFEDARRYFTSFILPHVVGQIDSDDHYDPLDEESAYYGEPIDIELVLKGKNVGCRLAPYLFCSSRNAEERAKAILALESLDEEGRCRAWQAMEAIRGLNSLNRAWSHVDGLKRILDRLRKPKRRTTRKSEHGNILTNVVWTEADIINLAQKLLAWVMDDMYEAGLATEAIRSRWFEPLVESGKKLRATAALGGAGTRTWTDEVEKLAKPIFDGERRHGVSKDAAARRAVSKLKANHGISISASTLKRHLLS